MNNADCSLNWKRVRVLRTLSGREPWTHTIPPVVTVAALAALEVVRHCNGLAGEQKNAWLTSATVAPLIAFTMPTP